MENNRLAGLVQKFDREKFQVLHEEISFSEYLERVWDEPRIVRTAYQRMYDMIMSHGTSDFKKYRKTYIKYNFFSDPDIPIFGLDETLNQLVQFVKGAARGYGRKRILLLHGPVGSEIHYLSSFEKRTRKIF